MGSTRPFGGGGPNKMMGGNFAKMLADKIKMAPPGMRKGGVGGMQTAQNRVEQIINKLKAESNLTEEMKNTDVLYWVGTMNAIKNQAEEIVFNELIYV